MEKYSVDHLRRLGLSRRVSQSREISIKPQNFLQAFDFNLLIGKKIAKETSIYRDSTH